ncbi:MAG: phage late control D family protein [Dehalococcoidia bacterium]
MVELSVPSGIVASEAAFEIDGRPQPRLSAALVSLVVEENTDGLQHCEARFGNWGSVGANVDYFYFDRTLLEFGKEMSVTMGAGESENEVFRGAISAIEGQFFSGEPPQIAVLAEDGAQDLRVTRRTRTFEDVTDAEVFEQIAGDHGLQSDIDLPGPTHKVVAQLNRSDLAFIRDRTQRLAGEVWVQGNTLHVKSRLSRQGNDNLSLQFNRGLMEFRATADTANQHTKVVVSGWDVQAKDTVSHEATASILSNELGNDQSGASVVSDVFGERVDRVARQEPANADEAQFVAEAIFRAQARRFVVGTGVARGDARIRVGRAIDLQGLGPLFAGNYYITEARHIFSRQSGGGYITEFVAERAGIGS